MSEFGSTEEALIREFGTATFSDKDPDYKSLGWSGGAPDKRDWRAANRLGVFGKMSGLKHWANPLQLDQGQEGACVAFAHTGTINAEPLVHNLSNEFAFGMYQYIKTIDEWPGTNYEGTSVRAGAQAFLNRGYYSAYSFADRADVLAVWVLNVGPAVIGVDWYEGMDRVDATGYISPTGEVRGGHAVVVDGVVKGIRNEEDRFRIRNSWGRNWGLAGRCRLRLTDMQKLLDDGGAACCPEEVAV